MTSRYGDRLDRNGYAPSIIPGHGDCQCWKCKKNGWQDPLNRHEVFGGALRKKAKELGLWVNLCHNSCHQGRNGVHNNRAMDLELKAEAQRCAMAAYGWTTEDFIREFGRNYLEEEE